MRRALIPAFLLLLGSAVLGATVLREPIARAGSSMSVLVSNSKTTPVPVQEVNTDGNNNIKVHEQGAVSIRDPEVAHQPWHIFLKGTDAYTVPAGKRLVIEFVDGIGTVDPSSSTQADWTIDVQGGTDGGQGYHFRGEGFAGSCTACYIVTQQVRIYATAGSVVSIGAAPPDGDLRLSGYLLDVQ